MAIESTKGTDQYPYWRNEFEAEFGDNDILYVEDKFYNKDKKRAKNSAIDYADKYRVFMILCNNSDKSRMEVLQMLKNATEENPIIIQNEIFWTESN